MKSVLVIGASTVEQGLLEQEFKLAQSKDYKVETTASFGQGIDWWAQNRKDVVILTLPDDLQLQNFFVIKLKSGDVPKDIPFIILTHHLNEEILELSSHFLSIRILKNPADGPTLFKAVNDLLTPREVGKQQSHPRFLTQEPAELFLLGSNTAINTVMRNLSKSGAYLESETNLIASLKAGESIRIKFELSHIARQYEMEARVVWIRPLTEDPKRSGIGISFISKDEWYNDLLKNFS